MGLTKSNISTDNITSLSTRPNTMDGLTGSQLQERFDKADVDQQTYLNDVLIPELDAALAQQEAGLTGHIGGTDHDARYYTKAQADSNFVTDAEQAAAIGTHAGSGDHDGRYYTKGTADGRFARQSNLDTLETTVENLIITGGPDLTVVNARLADIDYDIGKSAAEPTGILYTDETITVGLTLPNKKLLVTSAAAINITVPSDDSPTIDFDIGDTIEIVQYGTGKVTIVPTNGDVIIRSKDGLRSIAGQYAAVSLLKVNVNEWLLIGALVA